MECTIPSEARCPQCSAFAVDELGFTVPYCGNCGRCAHPSLAVREGRMRCNACGVVVDEAKATRAEAA